MPERERLGREARSLTVSVASSWAGYEPEAAPRSREGPRGIGSFGGNLSIFSQKTSRSRERWGEMPTAMRQVRSPILPFATALGVLGLLGGAWLGAGKAAKPSLAGASAQAGPGARVVHFEAPALVQPRDAIAAGSAGATEASPSGAVAELSAGEAAQFVALCQIRLLAADTDLDLSHREWAKLAATVAHAQAVRLNYEAEIANAEKVSAGHFRVEIPAYAAAGDELRRRFQADLRDELGETVAAEVWEKLGRRLEGSFAGFGVGSQTLEITGDPARAPAEVTIERTAHYWNSVDGGERVATRREVHFPIAEDPALENWTPLLALLGTSG